jgi:hypothetical protein
MGLLMCGWYDDDAKPRDDRDGVSVAAMRCRTVSMQLTSSTWHGAMRIHAAAIRDTSEDNVTRYEAYGCPLFWGWQCRSARYLV